MENNAPTPTKCSERLTFFERHFIVDPDAKVTLDDLVLILYNIRELAVAFEQVYFDEMKEGEQRNVFGAMAELVGQAIVLGEHFQGLEYQKGLEHEKVKNKDATER